VYGFPAFEIELATNRTWYYNPFSYHRSVNRVNG